MRTLLLNGCSFGRCWDPSNKFIEALECEQVENISKVATSFQRTCRSTVEWIAQNGDPHFVIVPITFSHRWELAIGEHQDGLDGNWFPMQTKEHLFTTKQEIRNDIAKDKLEELIDLYYGCIPNSRNHWDKMFTEIIMLSAFLDNRKINYLFFDMCNEFGKIDNVKDHSNLGIDKIKLIEGNKKIIDLFNFCGNRHMHDTMTAKENVHFNTHHAPEQYQELEKYLLKYLQRQ
jgi:hypothetical protein